MAKVRIPHRARILIEGTQAYQHPLNDEDKADGELFHRIMGAPRRKDGSAMVEMSDEDRGILIDYASAWVIGASDNAGPDDPDATADLNALRSLLRWLQQ
jgi:hypothetical protein